MANFSKCSHTGLRAKYSPAMTPTTSPEKTQAGVAQSQHRTTYKDNLSHCSRAMFCMSLPQYFAWKSRTTRAAIARLMRTSDPRDQISASDNISACVAVLGQLREMGTNTKDSGIAKRTESLLLTPLGISSVALLLYETSGACRWCHPSQGTTLMGLGAGTVTVRYQRCFGDFGMQTHYRSMFVSAARPVSAK
jgi:hypothetical protein